MELGRALAAPILAAIAIAWTGGFGATASASTFTVLGKFQTGTAATADGMDPAPGNATTSNGERAETSTTGSCGSIADDGADGKGCGNETAGKVPAGAGSSGSIAAEDDGGTSAGTSSASLDDSGPLAASSASSQESTTDSAADSNGQSKNALPDMSDRRQQIAALVSEASSSAMFDSFDQTKPQSSRGGGTALVRSDLDEFAFTIAKNDTDRSFLQLTTGDKGVAGSSGGSSGSGGLAPTPLPAAVWMLLAGLAAILGMGRWRRRPAEGRA